MAEANLSATFLPAHASPHPMANPGYGKRGAPDQLPRTAHDFAHLPPREAAIAAYIDRLPNGADISVKTLAKTLPYGQCALRTALNNLQQAGHLRRGREHLADSGSPRWITRTWFSRTGRDDDWWAAFTRGDVPQEQEPPADRRRPTRSRAYILLAALGRTTPALSLSAKACADLAPLLTEWFARGATDEHVLQALTAGLPTSVHSPAALVRNRLTSKLPPEQETHPTPAPPRTGVREVRRPGPPGGLARRCMRIVPGRARARPPRNTPVTLSGPRPRRRTPRGVPLPRKGQHMNPEHAVADVHASPSELEEPQRVRDEADIAEAREREANATGPALTHDAFMARLETEDCGEAAS